jgi:hypothetical protein
VSAAHRHHQEKIMPASVWTILESSSRGYLSGPVGLFPLTPVQADPALPAMSEQDKVKASNMVLYLNNTTQTKLDRESLCRIAQSYGFTHH